MVKPKNNVIGTDIPALAAMSRRILSRMLKNGSNYRDQRRLLRFLNRLQTEIAAFEGPKERNYVSDSH